jgi:hypothetical protein
MIYDKKYLIGVLEKHGYPSNIIGYSREYGKTYWRIEGYCRKQTRVKEVQQ